MTFYWQFEKEFIIWLQNLFSDSYFRTILIAINNLLSLFGEEILSIGIIGLIYWGINKEKAKNIGLIVIFASTGNAMIKNIFKRLRPYQVIEEISLLRNVDGFSFPSGHSCTSSSLYCSLALNFPKRALKIIAVILPLLVALSRNYLGAHWPSDVLVGLSFGYILALTNDYLLKKYPNKKIVISIIYLIISLIGILYCSTNDYYSSLGLLAGFIAASYFEEKKVNFANTDKWYLVLIRTVVGLICFVLLNSCIKSLFSLISINSTLFSNLMRSVRYFIDIFVMMALYPMAFRYEDKLFKKRNKVIE